MVGTTYVICPDDIKQENPLVKAAMNEAEERQIVLKHQLSSIGSIVNSWVGISRV